MSSPVKVLFRADKKAPHAVTAVFPTVPGTRDPCTFFSVFDSLSGHGSGTRGWYNETRAATPREYASTARHLREVYGYKLKVGKRFTRHDDKARREAV